MQNNIMDPATEALRPFAFFETLYPNQNPDLVRQAYNELKAHNRARTIRLYIEALGPTKPGLLNQLKSPETGLAAHEISTKRRKDRATQPDQTFTATIQSNAEHWATSGALKSINNKRNVDPATIQDVPTTVDEKMDCVRRIVDQIIDMRYKLNGDVHEARVVSFSSPKLLEVLGWDILVC